MAAQLRHHLALFGPGIGVRTLRADFPDVAFRDCAQIAARFRRDLRQQFDDCTMVACTWTTPGTVWATDVWQIDHPIDGIYRYILDVRDLASGYIIESMPLEHATAAAVGDTLERLYRTLGAPLAIKTDNGSEFTGVGSSDLHPLWGVEQLLSPPYTPQYNGACEAGHGSIRYRADMLARRDGRPGDWSLDHLEGARTWANDLPRIPQGQTPQQIFASRAPISTAQREQFLRACTAARQQRWNECRTAAQRHNRTIHLASSPTTVSRAAISAALRNLGYLNTRSVPIRQPIPYEKTSVISQ
jgi:transposase InsO family protein